MRTLPLVVQAVGAAIYWAVLDRAKPRPAAPKPIALRGARVAPRRTRG